MYPRRSRRTVAARAGAVIAAMGLAAVPVMGLVGGPVAAGIGAVVPAVPAQAGQTPTAQTWSVQPATADGADGRASWNHELAPGESVAEVAQVNNFGAQPLTFRVYSHDAINAPDGAFTLQPADVAPAQVGAWIGLDEQVTVEPGGSALVPFTITVPADATPGDHAGGIVASVTSESTDAEGQQVLVDNRVGSRVYLRVAGAIDPVLEVSGLQVEFERSWIPFSAGAVTVSYEVRNVGNVRLSGDQSVTGHGLFGLGDHTAEPGGLREILPGESVSVTTRIEDVIPLFRVTEEVAVNPRAPEVTTNAEVIPMVQAASSAAVWAMPWPELVIFAVIVLAVVWSWWRRRRTKRRTAALMDEAVAKAREEVRRELEQERATPAE